MLVLLLVVYIRIKLNICTCLYIILDFLMGKKSKEQLLKKKNSCFVLKLCTSVYHLVGEGWQSLDGTKAHHDVYPPGQ